MNKFFSSMSIQRWFAQETSNSYQADILVKCGHS